MAPSVVPSRASTSHSVSRSQAGSQASTSKQTKSQQSTTATSSVEERYTIAVHEQRGVGREIGLAMCQQEYAKVILTQFSDSSTCVKALHLCKLVGVATYRAQLVTDAGLRVVVNSKRPGVLIVLPSAAGVGLNLEQGESQPKDRSILVSQVMESFDDCQIVPVHRRTYNELAGK